MEGGPLGGGSLTVALQTAADMPPRKATLASRKMAKKGGQASFQSEVNSDEEWKFVLQKVGLVVVDVYSDWCGPCVGMMSNLKKVKLELGNEYLHLVIANADKIRALERFRGTSEPTWVFIATGQLLRVMYGSNAPLLMTTIEEELNNEMECIEGSRTRITRPFNERTPEELKRQEELNAKKRAEEEEEKREKDEQLDKVKRRYCERVARKTTKQSVMLYFPHTIEITDSKTKKKVCQPAYKMMTMYDQIEMSIKDQLEVQLTTETIPMVFYNSGLVLPKCLLKLIEEQPCMASLIQEYDTPLNEEEDLTESFVKARELEHVGIVEVKLATLAFGESMDPFNPSQFTVCHDFMFTTPKGIKIPPMWTPRNHLSKAAALEILFPYAVEKLGVEMEKLPPPTLVLIFEANRAKEILDAVEPYAEDVLHVAYFDSTDPASATKICQTIWEVQKYPIDRIEEMKMVIALNKTHSEPMLVLAQLNPLYMSSDARQGTKETELFFPTSLEEEKEPDPFAPAPVIEYNDGEFMLDEDGHRYRDEYVEEDGETVLRKRVIRLANGKSVDMLLDAGGKVEVPEELVEAPEAEETENELDEGERPGLETAATIETMEEVPSSSTEQTEPPSTSEQPETPSVAE